MISLAGRVKNNKRPQPRSPRSQRRTVTDAGTADAADKGRYSHRFLSLLDQHQRREFDEHTGRGRDTIFAVRENFNDYLFTTTFIEQDFVDRHRLFVADKVLDEQRMVWQWYVKSRNADQYKQMVKDSLYHPPHITVDPARTKNGKLKVF